MPTMFTLRHLSTAAALTLGFAGAATAASLTATQTLNQFNLVTLGDATISSHVDGRSYIGGTLSGNGAVFAMHANDMPASSYAGLTVAGSASNLNVDAGGATVLGSLSNANINNGAVVVGGNASNSNFNGSGGAYVYGSKSGVNTNSGSMSTSAAAARVDVAQSTSFASVLGDASANLKTLSSTGSYWNISGGRVTFHAVANSSGLAVFDLSAADSLLSYSEFSFDYGSASTVIFNSGVTSATINANFLGGSAQSIGAKTIWNFYQATSLTLNTQFGGSVLATKATLTNRNNVEGGVYVNKLNQQGEIHSQPFSGTLPTASVTPVSTVPEPDGWALMLAGLAALATVARRLRPS